MFLVAIDAGSALITSQINRRGPQMRGELKTKVRSLVELVFGFESGQNKKNVRKNRQLAEDLKEGLGYCYKVSLSSSFVPMLTGLIGMSGGFYSAQGFVQG